ncbi:hypothetical protein X777_12583, partial [Ooceraea biroi]
ADGSAVWLSRGDREDRKRAEQGLPDSAIHEASGRERRCKSLSCSINPTLDIALPEVVYKKKRKNISQERWKIRKSVRAYIAPGIFDLRQTCSINSLIVQVVLIVKNLRDLSGTLDIDTGVIEKYGA